MEEGVSYSFLLQNSPEVIHPSLSTFKVNPFSRTTEKSPVLDHWGPELSALRDTSVSGWKTDVSWDVTNL